MIPAGWTGTPDEYTRKIGPFTLTVRLSARLGWRWSAGFITSNATEVRLACSPIDVKLDEPQAQAAALTWAGEMVAKMAEDLGDDIWKSGECIACGRERWPDG